MERLVKYITRTDPLGMTRAGQQYYFHENGLWSAAALSNSAGDLVERYSYDAYGRPTVTDGFGVPIPPNAWGTAHSAVGNPYLFTGREHDEETGLYSYRARYYDAEKGRFLQRDPLGYVDGQNLYEYAKSNPLCYTDPTGEAAETIWDAINIGVGVVSLWCNVREGNAIGAVVDSAGILLDVGAAVVPFVPGGAGTAIKTVRLAKAGKKLRDSMIAAARTAQGSSRTAKVKVLRNAVTEFDDAHHLIPIRGPSEKWVSGTLRKRMDALRKRATSIGIDLDNIENGVALPHNWHINKTTAGTYYERVLGIFENLPNNKSKWLDELDKLAEDLMKESGKLK